MAASDLTHTSPCRTLENHQRENGAEFRRVYDKIDHPETGLGALNRGLNNSVDWQGRIEAAIKDEAGQIRQLLYVAVGALLAGMVNLAYLVLYVKH